MVSRKMCRIFAYIGNSKADLEGLVSALRKSSANDVVAEKAGLGKLAHNHGWGFTIYSEAGLNFHKSGEPLELERVDLPNVKGRILAIFHARLATNPNTVNSRFSHPFFGDTKKSFVFFSHNGSVDEDRLRKVLGYEGVTIDSELAFKYLLREGIRKGSKELEDYVMMNSALNLMILELPRDGEPRLYIKHYYNRDLQNKDKTDYYNLYYQKLPGGEAIFSSTLNHYGFSGTVLESASVDPFVILN